MLRSSDWLLVWTARRCPSRSSCTRSASAPQHLIPFVRPYLTSQVESTHGQTNGGAPPQMTPRGSDARSFLQANANLVRGLERIRSTRPAWPCPNNPTDVTSLRPLFKHTTNIHGLKSFETGGDRTIPFSRTPGVIQTFRQSADPQLPAPWLGCRR